MTPKVALLHAYSAENRGDGLLVELAVAAVEDALGPDAEITVFAHYPSSFHRLGLATVGSAPTTRGYRRTYLSALARLDRFDLVVAVGGGYLRFGSVSAAAKAALVHLPQLVAAASTSVPVVYLPQSIGPFRVPGSRALVHALLRRADRTFLRDDRSVAELRLANAARAVDMALPGIVRNRPEHLSFDPDEVPVISVRRVGGEVPAPVRQLTRIVDEFDGFVQSTVGANDDTAAMESIRPRRMLEVGTLMTSPGAARIVVAVRMHAALMALEAGHYVIHLAYERKGFSAFADLGLADFVHPVHRFSPAAVASQVEALRAPSARAAYDASISSARRRIEASHDEVRTALRQALGAP